MQKLTLTVPEIPSGLSKLLALLLSVVLAYLITRWLLSAIAIALDAYMAAESFLFILALTSYPVFIVGTMVSFLRFNHRPGWLFCLCVGAGLLLW